MIRSIKKIVLPVCILLVLGFALFVINQIAGVYLLVRANNVLAANLLLGGLSIMALILFVWPFVLYLKLPKPLLIPQNESELPVYRKRLIHRLRSNQILKAKSKAPVDDGTLNEALSVLDSEADKVVRKTATAVFLTTSVSQNGKLDALTILATQSRMVWSIAHVYYQRPTLRQLVYLYANVTASSFVASEIEDLDISQQIEPVIKSFFKNSAGKSIPVIGPTANIILDSLLEGSTNAFLTLRVGIITKKYCGCNEVTSKPVIRRSAFTEAAGQLRSIVLNSSNQIMTGILKATKKAGFDTLKSGWEGMVKTGQRMNPFRKRIKDGNDAENGG